MKPAISAALWRGLDIECGCFGTGSAARVGLEALAFDLAWLLASLAVLWLAPAEETTAPVPSRSRGAAGAPMTSHT